MGMPYLQRMLNHKLTNHICELLPALQYKFQTEMLAMNKDVKDCDIFCLDDRGRRPLKDLDRRLVPTSIPFVP